MFTDYDRYQLEWMLEHQHSLDELIRGLDIVEHAGSGEVERAYDTWQRDVGFDGTFPSETDWRKSTALTPECFQAAIASALRERGFAVKDDELGRFVITEVSRDPAARHRHIVYAGSEDDELNIKLWDARTWLDAFKSLLATTPVTATALDIYDAAGSALARALREHEVETVREWYEDHFPGDPLAAAIDPIMSFGDAADAIDLGGDEVYESLGVRDSQVRTRVAAEVARRCGITADELDRRWREREPLAGEDVVRVLSVYGSLYNPETGVAIITSTPGPDERFKTGFMMRTVSPDKIAQFIHTGAEPGRQLLFDALTELPADPRSDSRCVGLKWYETTARLALSGIPSKGGLIDVTAPGKLARIVLERTAPDADKSRGGWELVPKRVLPETRKGDADAPMRSQK